MQNSGPICFLVVSIVVEHILDKNVSLIVILFVFVFESESSSFIFVLVFVLFVFGDVTTVLIKVYFVVLDDGI